MTIEEVLQHNIRPHLFGLKPYSSARDDFKGKAEVWLDANENPYTNMEGYNRYPDPHQHALKNRIGQLKKIATDEIFLGNGSDEAIDLLFKATCASGKNNVIICPPTYGMYAVQAGIFDVEVRETPLDTDFQLITQRVLAQVDDNTRIIWLCSPNNPTGNLLNRDSIELILASTRAFVVVDEAYIDFAEEGSVWSKFGKQYPNLVVMQTFSKAWGLAGLRLGMLFANSQVISLLSNIKLPYNVSVLTQRLVLEQLNAVDRMNSNVAQILLQRSFLKDSLQALSGVLKVFPTQANYILFKVKDPLSLYTFLSQHGVVVRDRSSQPGCEGCLRVTVGTPEESQQFLSLTQQFLAANGN